MSKLSKVIIGTWPLSGDFGHVSLKTVEDALTTAYRNGFKTFDTAPNYGNGFIEFALGKVFYGIEDVVINTKCGNIPFIGKDFSVDALKKSLEDSLTRLATAEINTLFLHNPRDEVSDYEPIIRFMNDMKSVGLIKYSGISLAKGYRYSEKTLALFDIVQDDVNLLYQKALHHRLKHTTKLAARSPLATGILSGILNENATFPPDDHRSKWLTGERLSSLIKRVNAIQDLAPKIPLPKLARKFLFQEEKLDYIIFGVKRNQHIHDILNDLQQEDLPNSLINRLRDLHEADFNLVNERHLGF